MGNFWSTPSHSNLEGAMAGILLERQAMKSYYNCEIILSVFRTVTLKYYDFKI